MNKSASKSEKIILTSISLVFIAWCLVFIYRSSFIAIDGKRYFCLVDDAMISMRYAWNFSHGYGLVWNPGEYVQGYTNLLMTLLMSFSTWVFDKSTANLFIQILGIVFSLGIAFVSLRLVDYFFQVTHHQYSSLIRILTFAGILTYYPLNYWSLMGMETGLLTLLLVSSVTLALYYLKSRKMRLLIYFTILFGLAFLTRNDAIICIGLVYGYLFWDNVISGKNFHQLLKLVFSFCSFLVFVGIQLLFQHFYYGEVLPNTYTLKLTGLPFSLRFVDGLNFLKPFLIETSLMIFIIVIGMIVQHNRLKLLFFSFYLALISYQIYIGGDVWPEWRMISPVMPFVVILFINAISTIIRKFTTKNINYERSINRPQDQLIIRYYLYQSILFLIFWVGISMAVIQFHRDMFFITRPAELYPNIEMVNIALALDDITSPNATIAVFRAGTLPYFSGRKAIDILGKSDRYIAKLPPDTSGSISWMNIKNVPGHIKYNLDYSIKSHTPTFVEKFSWGTQDISEWAESKYVQVEYRDLQLFLLKYSPDVNWDKVNSP